jgi:ubiquinone/menaquinone biosynthesis C-methylase UbiE
VGSADPMLALATAVLHSGVAKPERVLEIECREGDGTLFLAREFPRAGVRGVDASAALVARARRRVGLDPEGRIAFKQGTPGALPFPGDHFDLVVQAAGRVAPREAARVLRPGGRLLLVLAEAGAGPLGLRRRRREARLSKAGFERPDEGQAGGSTFFVTVLSAGRGAGRSE